MRETLFPRPPEAPALPAWQADAARAQSLLSRASVEVGLESQANRDFIAYQLAEAIGPDVRLPNLEPQGFRFVRAQILRYGDQPLAQLLYLPAKRDPLSLYAMEGHRDRLPVFAQEGDIGTVFWCEDGIAYLLAGREDEATLYRLAEKIRNEPLPDRAAVATHARGTRRDGDARRSARNHVRAGDAARRTGRSTRSARTPIDAYCAMRASGA